jgi:hypothetical protein
VLSEQEIKSTDPSVRITAEEGKWIKEDVKDVKISVEGADVEIPKVTLHCNNHPDDTVWNVGTVKAGGQTAPKSAPGREGTLQSVTINYKILEWCNDGQDQSLGIRLGEGDSRRRSRGSCGSTPRDTGGRALQTEASPLLDRRFKLMHEPL